MLGSGGGQIQNRAVTILAQCPAEGTDRIQDSQHVHAVHLQVIFGLTPPETGSRPMAPRQY